MMKPTIGIRPARWYAVAGVALMLGCLAQAHASLVGDTVNARLYSPNGVIGDPTVVDLSDSVLVGAGIEISAGDGSNIGNGIMLPNESIDFGASSIAVRLQAGNTIAGGIPVTGYESNARYIFSGLDFSGAAIIGINFSVGASQIANLAALGSSWITLADPHTVFMNLADIQFVDHGSGESNNFANVTINLQTEQAAVVPEPATWLLLMSGLAGLALVRRGKGPSGIAG